MLKLARLLPFLLAGALASPAIAEDVRDMACKVYSETAEVVMEARQEGLGLQQVLDTFAEQGEVSDINRSLILEAYKLPRYETEENKRTAISDFRDNFLVHCLKP